MSKRIYMVYLNLDEVSAANDTFSDDIQRGEFLRGFMLGARGGECRFELNSPAGIGYSLGRDCYLKAKALQDKNMVAGKASARSRSINKISNVDSTPVEHLLNDCSNTCSTTVRTTAQPNHVSMYPVNNKSINPESQIEIDNDPKNEDNIFEAEIIKSAKPIPGHFKTRVSILDWVASGHPRISLRNDEKALWQAFLDAWSGDPDWKVPWQEMYDDLLSKLKEPNHMIFSQTAMQWMAQRYEPEVSNG